ncbi:MAG: protein kinase [Desulfobacterales bacterium]|nr:protein kinase [Desulfobacterales bacterium]
MDLPSYVGRFEVLNETASGGFAVVLRAWDEELECLVAIKLLHHKLVHDDDIQNRFLEEARLLRRIRSPHVIPVHDVGRLNDGRPYFVMDFADRGTLAPRLEKGRGNGDRDLQGISAIVDAVAEGLSAIHDAGLVHRDVKPANTLFQLARRGPAVKDHPAPVATATTPARLVAENERILIGDLGIAKDLVKHPTTATIIGGTPLYEAPEQRDPAATITPAADIYAATAMLWHVLTGKKPPAVNQIDQHLPALPAVWREVIARGMALQPENRFPDMPSWRGAAHTALAQEAIETQLDVPTQVALKDSRCPYKGLATYQPEDAHFFFGREALIDEIVRRFQLNRVLFVGGPSGSGKSSVVRAGFIPALKSGALSGSEKWRLALFTPGRDPLAELYFQLTRQLEDGVPALSLEDLMAHPTLARHLADAQGAEHPLLLCIDQFEELFTLATPAQQSRFIVALSAIADPADSKARIVITVRADFYAACAQIPWLAERITDNQVLVSPMTKSELRRAIVEPARPMGLVLEPGLVDTIIKEAGSEAGSLPLVAHALVETWNRRRGNTLTLEGFRAAGGVAGAISQTADAIFKDRFNPQERKATERLFLRLVTPGEGTPDTRRILARTDIRHDAHPEVMQRVVERLTEARLLTIDDTSIEIAHEALLRTWPRLQGWIEASRDELRSRQRIIRAAAEWDAEGRDPDLLYRGTPLLSALEWAAGNPEQLGGVERAFLDAAAETKARADAAAVEKQRRTRKVRRIVSAVLSALALGATTASIVAFVALRQARLNAERADAASIEARDRFAAALGVGAFGMVDSDPLLALVLAAEAVARAVEKPPAFDARATLLAARQALMRDGPVIVGSPLAAGDALAIALSPDGRVLASAQRDGTIDLIDLVSRKSMGPRLNAHRGGIRDVDFSPDNRWLVSAGNDGTLRLWPLSQRLGEAGRKIGESGDVIMSVDFSPDGTTVSTGNGDGTVQIWDVVHGRAVGRPLIDLPLSFSVVEFSPNGRGLIASTHDGRIFGWALPSRNPLFDPVTGVHTSHLLKMAFSPGGNRFATASTDGTSSVIAFPSGRVVGRAFKEDQQIGTVLFGPGGQILIGGDADGRINLWDVVRQKPIITTPRGHSRAIIDAELSQDGQLLATLGQDQVIRLWRFDRTQPLAREMRVDGQSAKAAAFSRDGRLLAVGDDAGAVKIWELETHQPLMAFQGKGDAVWALAFSHQEQLLAAGDRSGRINFWDLNEGKLQHTMAARGGAIWSLAFTRDGKRLVSVGEDEVNLWDVTTRTPKMLPKQKGRQNTRGSLSPDGTLLALTSTRGDVRVWDLAGMSLVREIKADDDVLWSVTFSPDARRLAVASSEEVVSVWDLATGQQQAAFTGHSGGATDVAFLADGVTLVVVDRSGRLHWWDVHSGRKLAAAWPAHAASSWRIAVHPDGGRFATTGDDGKIKIWDPLSVARACEIARQAFDAVRRQQYLGPDAPSLACD